MDVAKHERLFSATRFAKYLKAFDGHAARAMQLYKLNIQACQALYPLISVLEVSLRNSIDREMSKHFADDTWLLTRRNDFANHPSLLYKNSKGEKRIDRYFANKLLSAEAKLMARSTPVLQVTLLAELTFGFWVKFFDTAPIKILKGAPLQAFANKPGLKLERVHAHLNSIVSLRNRISHNEPICFNRQGKLCVSTMKNYQENISLALSWLDSELGAWTQKLDFFKPVLLRIGGL